MGKWMLSFLLDANYFCRSVASLEDVTEILDPDRYFYQG